MSHAPSPGPQHELELPLHTPGAGSLAMAAAIALVAWLAFAAQTDVTIGRMLARGYGVIDGLERMSSYLTNLTVLICAICFSCVATRARPAPLRFFRKPPVVTAIVVYVVFVGLAYNLLLRFLWTPSGYRALLNETLHTIVPLLAALYWVLFVPRFHLRLRQCLLWLVYPLSYLFVTLWRGSTTDFYPYYFINVAELGYQQVLFNATLLVLAFLTLMGIFLAINHRRPHTSATSATRPRRF
ncbi:Pr6Pr family membrane protein [Paraburkholderia saeva]|uniref:Pr6Pr family membrane protein n=1 Tax=Paraburkholderia saeva TaxID=2777537 RepID=UPI001E405DB4|nr:Pr6Pr family membrane protein [Paraburkholderia saeva]